MPGLQYLYLNQQSQMINLIKIMNKIIYNKIIIKMIHKKKLLLINNQIRILSNNLDSLKMYLLINRITDKTNNNSKVNSKINSKISSKINN